MTTPLTSGVSAPLNSSTVTEDRELIRTTRFHMCVPCLCLYVCVHENAPPVCVYHVFRVRVLTHQGESETLGSSQPAPKELPRKRRGTGPQSFSSSLPPSFGNETHNKEQSFYFTEDPRLFPEQLWTTKECTPRVKKEKRRERSTITVDTPTHCVPLSLRGSSR